MCLQMSCCGQGLQTDHVPAQCAKVAVFACYNAWVLQSVWVAVQQHSQLWTCAIRWEEETSQNAMWPHMSQETDTGAATTPD